jgi:Leucine-rich repeat (LRR) protein
MRSLFAIWFCIAITSLTFAQREELDQLDYIPWETAQHMSKDSVLAITFEKLRLTEIPAELWGFTKLAGLNLGKNKLVELPNDIKRLSQLKYLYLNKNKLRVFPQVVYHLFELEVLDVSRNDLSAFPQGVSSLQNLVYLDLWDTNIPSLPDDLVELKKLAYLDMRGMTYAPTFLERWEKRLPNTQVEFDPPCNCME